MSCVYLHEGKCIQKRQIPCNRCEVPLAPDAPDFLARWVDPLTVIDRRGNPASDVLRNMLAGGSAFLFCGGPSANEFPLELLNQRGIWTLAVNNAAGHPRIQPQAFVCSDPPLKFSHSIWLDPKVMKFVPNAKLHGYRAKLRQKINGEFSPLSKKVTECPNVWAFKRWSWLSPNEKFFTTDGACWGNQDKGCQLTSQPKTVGTMLLGMRLLRFLGAKRIYLVGVDFHMHSTAYNFDQDKKAEAHASNNHQYSVLNAWLCELESKGVFSRFGVEFYNCYQNSGLRAFPYVPFEDAVREAQGIIETVPDLRDWYSKG